MPKMLNAKMLKTKMLNAKMLNNAKTKMPKALKQNATISGAGADTTGI